MTPAHPGSDSTQPSHPHDQPPNAPSHGHSHDHPEWADRGKELVNDGETFAPMVDQALAWLAERVPDVRSVLDVGTGPGVAACSFAELIPAASVLAVDGSGELLDLARSRAARLGVGDRLATRQVTLPDDLAELPQADIVWVSGVVHHLPDPVAALRALGALVRPGGLLAVREGGLPTRFLPDGAAPGLLSRLEAVSEDLVAAAQHPAGVVPRAADWPDLLREAGLHPAGSKSFLLDLPAPVTTNVREWIHGRLAMLLRLAAEDVSGADRALLDRLLDPAAPDGLLRRSDLFLLAASTVHTARP
ncbi:class I SAM-dependent methyltransferase [Streptomyces sp. NPDC004647]|uniref:class I SAM-dependent methyltransferase n=1 Tax=Streptomyces sp. NPDC004647 TaxID=3154671 RepID=UPI0033A943E7